MKIIFFILSLLTVVVGVSQEAPTDNRFNRTLDVYYPNYYYFDDRFRISKPLLNTGIKYGNLYKKRNFGYHLSLSMDVMRDYSDADQLGDIIDRLALYPSFGIFKPILTKKHAEIKLFAEANHRFGQISWFAYDNWFETVYGYSYLIDFGASAGFNARLKFKHNFSIVLDGKYSFYVYRFNDGDNIPNLPGSPPHVLTVSLGVGWKLKAKVK